MSRNKSAVLILVFSLIAMILPFSTPTAPAYAASDIILYGDALASGWSDWSWGNPTRSFSNATPKHGGSASLSVAYTSGWSGLQFGRNDALSLSGYDVLRFWVHGGGTGGQQLSVTISNSASSAEKDFTPQANTWTLVEVSLATLQPAEATLIQWFNNTAGTQPIYYLDDITIVDLGGTPTPTPLPSAGPALSIDVNADRRAISPYIYGINYASEALAQDLRLPVRRWGGNATTRYNWRVDTSNRAMDYYFENIPESNPNPSTLPAGSSADRFIEQDRRTGTQTLMTLPMIGWVAKAREKACGFSVAKYGAQQHTDPYMPDCGNGVRTNGQYVTGNDPTDTSLAVTPTFIQDWIRHLQGRFGTAANGGVRFYNLDNEPMLWNSTHRDIHPQPPSYDELRDRTYAYAAAVKAVDPAAQTLGPAEWGWSGYFWSALDAAPGGQWYLNPQDRNAHGGVPLVAWYLQQMRTYEQQNGVRILDYLDLHNYPQNGVALSSAGDANKQALRLRSTRSLWDATYTDESWIDEPVRLIPRMREWIDQNYPGTKIAIGEYNWGALDHINGALAQTDILGIFGREGVDLATLWEPPTATQPGAFAFRLYRNYDGAGAMFGETSVRSRSTDQEKLAVYGAMRTADGALTLVIVNKTTEALTSDVSLANFNAVGTARVYRYDASNLNAIMRQADQAVANGRFRATFPANSATVVVVNRATTAAPTISSLNPASALMGDRGFDLIVNGTNFTNASRVCWNGVERTTTFVSATQVRATIPASDVIAPGRVNITAANGTAISAASVFTIKNMLVNGSFETDTNADTFPDSWNGERRATRTTEQRRNGSYALRLARPGTTPYSVAQPARSITGSRIYTISGWFNVPATAKPVNLRFEIYWRNAAGSVISTSVVGTYTTDTVGAWSQLRQQIVAPATATQANVRIAIIAASGPVYVDDVAFSE